MLILRAPPTIQLLLLTSWVNDDILGIHISVIIFVSRLEVMLRHANYQARRNHGVFEADLLRSNIERYNEAVTELDRDITDIVRAEIQSHSHDDDDRNSKELQTWLQKYYLPKRPQLLKL